MGEKCFSAGNHFTIETYMALTTSPETWLNCSCWPGSSLHCCCCETLGSSESKCLKEMPENLQDSDLHRVMVDKGCLVVLPDDL